MSHSVCHTVTNSVSHTCPDQTRPDQTFLTSAVGLLVVTKSIHRHSVKASRADAWMAADAAIGGGR